MLTISAVLGEGAQRSSTTSSPWVTRFGNHIAISTSRSLGAERTSVLQDIFIALPLEVTLRRWFGRVEPRAGISPSNIPLRYTRVR